MSHLRAIIEPVSPVDWQPWHTAAFLDAQRRRRPILLLLETAWAPACAAAHAAVFDRPDVQQAIAETVVAVRVDADRRPDLADRYGLGHWPSVLVLTPEGRVVTGGTRLDERFASRLRQIATACVVHDRAWRAGHGPDEPLPAVDAPSATATGRPDDEVLGCIADDIWAARDPEQGVWLPAGRAFADCAVFALAHGVITGDPAWQDGATATLDRLRPWWRDVPASPPASPDMPESAQARLDGRAAWLMALAQGIQVSGRDDWQPDLAVAVDRLVGTWRRPDGTWRPWVDAPDLVLVDATALACRALLAAARALDDPSLAVEAIAGLETVTPHAYARGAGVSHVVEHGRARGPMLLDDAMALAHALLDAQEWRAEPVYRDLAEELLRTATARLGTPTGALTDRVAALAGGGRIGRLADPWPPLTGNAWAARLAIRLWPDDADAREMARRMLRGVSAAAVDAGPFGACVGLAWHAVAAPGRVMAAW